MQRTTRALIFWLSTSFFFSLLCLTSKKLVAGTYQGISVSTSPVATQTWSSTVTISVTINGDATNGGTERANYFFGVIDGGIVTPIVSSSSISAATLTLDTTTLQNGPHRLFVWVCGRSTNIVAGSYGPVTFTTDNGHIPWQLRNTYSELWMTPGQTVQLIPKLVYTDRTEAPISATNTVFAAQQTALQADPMTGSKTVATVDSSGHVTAQAIGDTTVTLTAAGLTEAVPVHVNDINVTPHFGYDGSLLTSYTPGKSLFVSSMFSLNPTTDPTFISQLHAAGVNTFEGGFVPYGGPVTAGETSAQWIASENGTFFQPYKAALDASGMSIMLTGDDVAGTPDNLYNLSRGPGEQMTPNALTSAMSLAVGLGRTIGIEMVDEVSYRYGYNPYPKGQIGVAGGPQQITCVTDVCTVNWPTNGYQRYSLMLGDRFLITGATSNPNLNRPSSNIYSAYNQTATSFQFNSTGVGTQTFTAQTDPNLVIQAFAYGPAGPGGTDYVHNDAISVMMDQIHAAGNYPPITWPVAGNTPHAVRLWQGDPQFADFNNIYFPGTGGYPWGADLISLLSMSNSYFDQNYNQEQRDRPTIMESLGTTGELLQFGSVVPVASLSGDTVTFSQPHGVSQQEITEGFPRFTLSGNSNSALNGRYYIYAVPDAFTAKVYTPFLITASASTQESGMIAHFPDGDYAVGYVSLFPVEENSDGSYSSGQMGLIQGASGCAGAAAEARTTFTLSDPGNAAFDNTRYYVNLYGGIRYDGTCTLRISSFPSGSGLGGSANMIASDFPPPTNNGGQLGMAISDNIVWAAAKGGAGVRVYHFRGNLNKINAFKFYAPGYYPIDPGVNPQYNGPDAIAGWNAMGYANNLVHSIEPYLLQPKMQSPDYGPFMVTAARSSGYGKLLLMANFTEASDTETVDLSPYNSTGGSGVIYRMTSTSLTNNPISGTSTTVTFAPGETVAFVFPRCSYALNTNSINVGGVGASGTITITMVPSDCPAPPVSSNVGWASILVAGNTASWTVNANATPQSRNAIFTVAGQTIAVIQASITNAGTLTLNRSVLNFGTSGSLLTSGQTVMVGFTGGSGVPWTVNSSQSNIRVSGGGTGNGSFTVTVVAGASGTVTISAPGAANSPLQVTINVKAVSPVTPFGAFETPTSGQTAVAGAIAVTGWALDNIEVTKVDIWREAVAGEPTGLFYVGDAVFVPDARPDVASIYPTFPFQYRAGWGYMLLTNFLPNNGGSPGLGNGIFVLHAIAHNSAGNSVDLGTKTITVDNAHASKPFGTLDTPAQGASISGNAYVNFGWALTQNPYQIPADGSTLTVYVDGQPAGHPAYNVYRSDIANLFPGLANSNGAIGFFYIDTTKLSNGIHTISWAVYDNQNRGDGIGSRYFTVQNSGTVAGAGQDPVAGQDSAAVSSGAPEEMPDVEIEELDRIELKVGATHGYAVVNGEQRPLPVGSSMKGGVFFWQPGPGFLGDYQLVFERPGSPDRIVRVTIRPKRFL